MQSRPYDDKDGLKIWLSREERADLLAVYADDKPRRRIALQLGLHGLRTDEIAAVEPRHLEPIDAADAWRLVIPDAKAGKRETPVSSDLRERIKYLKSASRMRQDDPVIDVSTRSIRDWITGAREQLAVEHGEDRWLELTMHDLRRTFATDGFYTLAFAGVPIAEQLIMSFGGWEQTETGRTTFRKHYLGPVPGHITARAIEELGLP